MPDNSERMGPWEADRQEIVHKRANGTGLYSEIDEQLEFRKAVARLATDEIASVVKPTDIAYFVLADKLLFEKVRPSADRVPMLQNSSRRSRSIPGNLWFVPKSLAQGYAIDTKSLIAEEVFREIETLDAGERPTIIVDFHPKPRLYIYPGGISQPDISECLDLLNKSVAIQDIEMALEGSYRLLRSPDQMKALPLWKNSEKWYPVEKAEDAIQNQVIHALAGRFAHIADVRSEQPSTIGRTDVELVQERGLPNGSVIRHALIELKVLRSYGSTGKPVSDRIMRRHISQGVRQAAHYGNANNSKIRMLCCYDMRKKDVGDATCFEKFYGPCKDRNVHLKRYFLYNSSAALRQAFDNIAVSEGASPLPE